MTMTPLKRLHSSLLTWLLLASWPVVTSHALLEHLGVIHAACADQPETAFEEYAYHHGGHAGHSHASGHSHGPDDVQSEPIPEDSDDSSHHHHSDHHAVADGGYLRNSGDVSLLRTGCRVNGSLAAYTFTPANTDSIGWTPKKPPRTRLASAAEQRVKIWQFLSRSAPRIRAPSLG